MWSGPGSLSISVMPESRILVADDDPGVLQSLSAVLREQGFDVSTARGGVQLID